MTNETAKFAIVAICLIIASRNKDYVLSRRDSTLLTVALAFTLIADLFLIILFVYPPGLIFFSLTQILYVLRFGGKRAAMLTPLAAIMPAVLLATGGDILIVLAVGYAQLFILSYICMLTALKRKSYPIPNQILIFAGMTLFVLCDISVAVWNLGRMGVLENNYIAELAINAIWLFYAPSQICLALSGHKFAERGASYGGN